MEDTICNSWRNVDKRQTAHGSIHSETSSNATMFDEPDELFLTRPLGH